MSARLPAMYPRVLAHRCGGALAPENTLAGLQASVLVGCQGVEFDVMLSADGTPFVIHDETLERTTTGTGNVCETSDTVLMQIDAGIKHHPAFAGEKLPTFEQIARHCCEQGLAANIEIKPSTGHDVETGKVVTRKTAEIWAEAYSGAVAKTKLWPPLLSSFSEEALLVAAQVAPQLCRVLLVEGVPVDWAERCQHWAVAGLHVDGCQLSKETAWAIKAAGYWLGVYTENDVDRACELLAWGVDVVITDRPDRVRG